MIILLLGAPGAGKGTISEFLIHNYNFKHLSTGNAFREIINHENSPLSKKLQAILASGGLVDNETTNQLISIMLLTNDLKNSNIILDGYPRNLEQVEFLSNFLVTNNLKLDYIINLEINDDVILERLSNRLFCPKCNRTYHKTNKELKPKQEWICDDDGSELSIREDDSREKVLYRLNEFKKQTEPIIDWYSKHRTIHNVNAVEGLDKLKTEIIDILKLKS